MQSVKLYELAAEYVAVLDAESENDVVARLDAIADAIETKVDSVAALTKELEATAEAAEREAQRLHARSKSASNRAKRLREYVRVCLAQAGLTKVQSARFTVRRQGRGRKVVVCSLDALRAACPQFVHETVAHKADLRALAEAFKQAREHGVVPEGAELLEDGSVRLPGVDEVDAKEALIIT